MQQQQEEKDFGRRAGAGRRMDWWTMGFAVVVFALGLCASGCGNSEADAKSNAQTFVTAMGRGDSAAMRDTMTAVAKRRMADYPDFAEKKAGGDNSEALATYGNATIEGEYARVPVILQEENETQNAVVRLRFEEARWRVYALDLTGSTSGSPLINIDFEQPEATIGSAFRGLGQAMGALATEFGKGLGAFARGMKEGAASARGGIESADAGMAKMEKGGREIGEALQGAGRDLQSAARQAETIAERAQQEAERAAERATREAENAQRLAEAAQRGTEEAVGQDESVVRGADGSITTTTSTREGNKTMKTVVTRGVDGTETSRTTTITETKKKP